ncbi:MAG: epoxyqueuosine reductase QueH [Oscillospiraceae bacterium]|nr:epoxyqueuosine reductase QueH [Oscillospiraceae bacterium]
MSVPKRNYRIEQEKIIKAFGESTPRLLLHSCCAPCSSAVLEYLSQHMAITVFYFNPNIFPEEEFLHRIEEQKRLISEMLFKKPVQFIEHGWQQERFYAAVKGLESIPEGGERCFACYRLRLEETAKLAAEKGFDYFTTTLSISPYKNADKLNEIGEELAEKYGVKHLPSDFKKRDGYKRSIELSAEYGLYRQDYCGCVFSKKEREQG